MNDPYRQLVAELPRPTEQQTFAFVHFVTGAHSWYKHLPPLHPGSPFIFFLNPNAGKQCIQTQTGETAFVDRVKGDGSEFHYTWMPTATYREEYGHWDYYNNQSTTFFVGASGGLNEYSSRACCLSGDGEWISVSDDLQDASTCHLTAMVHLHKCTGLRTFQEYLAQGNEYAEANPDDPEVIRTRRLRSILNQDQETRYGSEGYKELQKELDDLHKQERAMLLERMGQAMRRFLDRLDDV